MDTKQIIQKLGGTTKTAELCEITPSAVTQWISNGIPKAQLKFLQLARPDIFSIDPPKKNRANDAPQQVRETGGVRQTAKPKKVIL